MAVIPWVHRGKLPQSLQYPLRYSDIEALFAGAPADPLYLTVSFWLQQEWRKADRERVAEEGRFRLMELRHRPGEDGLHWRHFSDCPWRDVASPVVVDATITAVPREVLAAAGLHRARLREILTDQVDRVRRRGWFGHRWEIRLTLLRHEDVVESLLATWTGLRPEPEQTRRWALREAPP